jgi:hypothetical protein
MIDEEVHLACPISGTTIWKVPCIRQISTCKVSSRIEDVTCDACILLNLQNQYISFEGHYWSGEVTLDKLGRVTWSLPSNTYS